MILKHLKQIIFLVAGATSVSVILCVILFVGIRARSNQTEVIFLDIGQGDSTLIKTKYGVSDVCNTRYGPREAAEVQ